MFASHMPGPTTAATLALLVSLALLSCRGSSEPIPDQMEGDIEESVSRIDTDEMPGQAEAFLATDRPWRAARVMRRYLEVVDDPPAEHRVLAARAEAGYGGWPAVRSLLADLPNLDAYYNGIGLYLLARAHDEYGDAAAAVTHYRDFLALSPPAGALERERGAAQLRMALALIRAGDHQAASREMQAARTLAGDAASWLDVLRADALAHTGDQDAVRQQVAGFGTGYRGLRGWRARIDAARHAGDLAQARAIANQAREWARTDGTRAEFFVEAARAAIDLGDVGAGRAALRSAIDLGAATPAARDAADMLRAGDMTPADHLAVARVYRAQGLHEESLEGYRNWLEHGGGTAGVRSRVIMEYANALFYAERYDEVQGALRPIASQQSARMLEARALAHMGETADAESIYLALDGQTGNGLALYLAADIRHAAGDDARARELYQRVISRYAGSSYMGLSMMRMAGMHFLDGEYQAAARIWDDYRSRYPSGTHAHQSLYWSARAQEELGNESAAAGLFRQVRQRARDSYYGLLASQRLGENFWPLPMGASPPDSPAAAQRVAGWMQGIDLLRAAGFYDEASAEADRVVAAAGSDRATLFSLAEALVERGYSQRAIRIGLRLQGAGQNRRLLRILYPFPYRTLISEEARDRELDPFVTAALIRQESMFEERITSHVGARGLMQIMPATGRRLAEAAGIEDYDPEILYHAETNVHLGTRYVAQHWGNYDGSLPSVFSAYNAGAHRVEWWSEYPEYGHDELFTERIPFRETRDYVKILTTNRAIYEGLYGDEGG